MMIPQLYLSLPKSALFMLLALPHVSLSMSLVQRRHYRRPICDTLQSCSYNVMGMDMGMCDCSGEDKSCPMGAEYSIKSRGTVYQFCQPREATVCEDGQVATVVDSIQTSIHCICPDEMSHIKRKIPGTSTVEFICQVPSCRTSADTCAVLEDAGVRQLCKCRTGSTCAFPLASSASSSGGNTQSNRVDSRHHQQMDGQRLAANATCFEDPATAMTKTDT